VQFGLYKRLNGYKPFLYNMTLDGCRFLKSRNPNPIALYFYNLFKDYSNINHTCPYNVSIPEVVKVNIHITFISA